MNVPSAYRRPARRVCARAVALWIVAAFVLAPAALAHQLDNGTMKRSAGAAVMALGEPHPGATRREPRAGDSALPAVLVSAVLVLAVASAGYTVTRLRNRRRVR